LRPNTKGIRFKTWLYLFYLTISILALLWALQIVFLKPYYRNMKITDIRNVAGAIEESLITNKLSENIVRIAVENNVCAVIYNKNYQLVYSVDSLGVNCFLTRSPISDQKAFIEEYVLEAQAVAGSDYYFTMQNTNFRQEMIFYGKEVKVNLTEFYVFINAPIEPLDSTISILQDQFIYVTIAVLFLSTVISGIISFQIAKPLANMTESARKLAHGDVNVKFDYGGYSEIDDLADTLNFATGELSKMDELRRDLIANVSHDIKTPLTMIKAYAEMIKELSGDNPIKRNEHLDIILSEANHLNRLVNDMLQLSSNQANKLTIETHQFSLKRKVTEIVGLFAGYTDSGQAHFELDIDRKLKVEADEVKIGQVLFNFINNAIRHIGEDKKIIIKAEVLNGTVRIFVTDHGAGIATAHLPYIWDRYYKIDKNYTRETDGGTGLGLAIAKSICVAHQLNYGVVSTEGEGATFYVDLPLV
jgi:two-component system, OmpR family, sensor histidine kinase ArlS